MQCCCFFYICNGFCMMTLAALPMQRLSQPSTCCSTFIIFSERCRTKPLVFPATLGNLPLHSFTFLQAFYLHQQQVTLRSDALASKLEVLLVDCPLPIVFRILNLVDVRVFKKKVMLLQYFSSSRSCESISKHLQMLKKL